MRKIKFEPVCFESLGAKSSCTLVTTPDVNILIDPGVAMLQPSFPASQAEKLSWREQGKGSIREASGRAEVVVISHYHYDHYLPEELNIYTDKRLFIKDPNQYINNSQRARASHFLERLSRKGGEPLSRHMHSVGEEQFHDPFEELLVKRDFGDYAERREELLARGRREFQAYAKKWAERKRIQELKLDSLDVSFAEGREVTIGSTKLRFTPPLFHGIEYSRLGWVFATTVEYRGEKLLHSSDIDGPIIEDYAEMIVKEKPDVLILDGPTTYMLGFMLNMINFNRTLENAVRIIEEAGSELILYDHHLLRDVRYRERTQRLWETAESEGKSLLTVAEYLGREPVALKYG